MTQLTVKQLIKHFETFPDKYSVIGSEELSNYSTICKLKRFKKDRIFNVQHSENDNNCILIWNDNNNNNNN